MILRYLRNEKVFNRNEKFNSLTRLIILVTLITFLIYKDKNILIAGVISIIITVIIYLFTFNNGISFKKIDNFAQNNNVLGNTGDIIDALVEAERAPQASQITGLTASVLKDANAPTFDAVARAMIEFVREQSLPIR